MALLNTKRKINSIDKIRKITRAMQLVAVNKMRKTEDGLRASVPYSEKILRVIMHIANSSTTYKHPYLVNPEKNITGCVGYIIISTDKGLCGALNSSLFRKITNEISTFVLLDSQNKKSVKLCLFGTKAANFFGKMNLDIAARMTNIGAPLKISDIVGSAKVMFDLYDAGKIDKLFVVSNIFVNKMKFIPKIFQLIPFVKQKNVIIHNDSEIGAEINDGHIDDRERYPWDYIYEPEAKILLDTLMKRYVETQIYQAVINNLACEQAARMIAMKNATDNAEELVRHLKLIYNRQRQTSITQEISEIIGGAASV